MEITYEDWLAGELANSCEAIEAEMMAMTD